MRAESRAPNVVVSTIVLTCSSMLAACQMLAAHEPGGAPPPVAPITKSVRWINTPGRPMTVARSAAAPSCQAGQVQVTDGGRGAYHDATVQTILIRNTSAADCDLEVPAMHVVSPSGDDVDVGPGDFGGTKLTLSPSEQATIMVGAPAPCAASSEIARSITVVPTAGSVPVEFETWIALSCASPSVMDFEDSGRPEPTSPLASLAINVAAPESAGPGQNLRYIATLTNPTDRDIALTPCPSYTQSLKAPHIHQTLRLNCAGAGEVIKAGDSVDFEMQINIPSNVPSIADLGWHLEVSAGESDTDEFAIQ